MPEAFQLVEDSVQEKRSSRFIEVGQQRYLGNVYGVVTGIGLSISSIAATKALTFCRLIFG